MENCSRLLNSSSLSIECRQCGLCVTDDYEGIGDNTLQSMHCTACGAFTHFVVLECSNCSAETLFLWAIQPAVQEFNQLHCAACARRYFDETAGNPFIA